MYHPVPGLVLGFHGCDQAIAEKVLAGKACLQPSKNDYDWLGDGIYFWENSPSRALKYAHELASKPRKGGVRIHKPAVIGAVLDLGFCLDLLEASSIQVVQNAYEALKRSYEQVSVPLPANAAPLDSGDFLVRKLDCAVMRMVHALRSEDDERGYDTVRAAFWEGMEIYENAGFREKNHIQICVRNPNCIKGYFRPLSMDANYIVP